MLETLTVDGIKVCLRSKFGQFNEYAEFKIKDSCLNITRWPTGNCQLSSIAYMNSLFTSIKADKIIEVIKACYQLLGYMPALVLMDVNACYVENVEKIFKIVSKTPYKNGNGHDMCLFIIKFPE